MNLARPDLSNVPDDIVAYIAALEAELERQADDERSEGAARPEIPLEPSEPPTTMQVISVSASGLAKRTPRHLYLRQRRGGMGIFDLDSPSDDPPKFLVVADQSAGLLLVTDQSRAFRLEVATLAEAAIRSRGQSLLEGFPLRPNEKLALVVPDQGGTYLLLASQRGQVRRIGRQYLGKSLQPGTVLYDPKEGGAPAAASWSSGSDELFIATKQGKAIRFAERLVPVRGCLGLRVEQGDQVVGIAAAGADGGVFLLNSDGKGTIRLFSGFAANKEPGAGGKVAMKTDELIGAAAIHNSTGNQHDLFCISQLGKIVRFQAAEVPAKEGVVQGVNCMSLRADSCTAFTVCTVG